MLQLLKLVLVQVVIGRLTNIPLPLFSVYNFYYHALFYFLLGYFNRIYNLRHRFFFIFDFDVLVCFHIVA